MSLAEVLSGLHWEAECRSDTVGMGPMFVEDLPTRPPWAVIYLIAERDTDPPPWEIGTAGDFVGLLPPPLSMPRAPILSSRGLGVLVNFSSGYKVVRFADAVPPALKRYMKRLEREAEARGWETAGNRAAAWERLAEATRS